MLIGKVLYHLTHAPCFAIFNLVPIMCYMCSPSSKDTWKSEPTEGGLIWK
jgi:hypothetical protein